MAVGPGDIAPDFTLPGTGGVSHSLSSYRGRPVVIVFYPGDDSPVCTKQLNSYNDELGAFNDVGAQVLAISAQDLNSHENFSTKHGFRFPLLAVGPLGFPRRSVFVVDAAGIITYAHRAIAGLTYRPVAELVAAVEAANRPG
jgi:peroxiredoxin Q/BCP